MQGEDKQLANIGPFFTKNFLPLFSSINHNHTLTSRMSSGDVEQLQAKKQTNKKKEIKNSGEKEAKEGGRQKALLYKLMWAALC